MFCGVGALGSLRAGASGVSAGRPDSALFAATGARLGAEWPLRSGFLAQFMSEALLSIRPRSVLLNDYSVWDLPRVTGRLALGFVAEF